MTFFKHSFHLRRRSDKPVDFVEENVTVYFLFLQGFYLYDLIYLLGSKNSHRERINNSLLISIVSEKEEKRLQVTAERLMFVTLLGSFLLAPHYRNVKMFIICGVRGNGVKL